MTLEKLFWKFREEAPYRHIRRCCFSMQLDSEPTITIENYYGGSLNIITSKDYFVLYDKNSYLSFPFNSTETTSWGDLSRITHLKNSLLEETLKTLVNIFSPNSIKFITD